MMDTSLIKSEDKGRYIQATRADGLEVFFDKGNDALSEWLNVVRKHGTRKQVFLAVGMARGLQIALNYAEKYGTPEEVTEIRGKIQNLISDNPVKQIGGGL